MSEGHRLAFFSDLGISRSRKVNDFRRFNFLRWLQANVRQHGSATKLAFESKLRRVVFRRRADADLLGVELFQEPGNIEMEATPSGFAIVLATCTPRTSRVARFAVRILPPPAPVVVTGYSADVISDKHSSARFAQPFSASTFAWFEAGAVDDSVAQHDNGLPAGLTFSSATGSGATYQIQAANANSVLQLGGGQTGTLTLTTPAAYSTLYVLASSSDGTPTSVGSGTINFADGGTQVFDWCNGSGGLHPEAVLKGPIGRADVGPIGTAFTYNQDCDFQVYETVIATDPSHAGVAIASIDFTVAPDASYSNIFGVSGK
jgi:hypothetical protein